MITYKYKMNSTQSTLGLTQLERVDELAARKREICGWRRDALAGPDGLTLNAEPPGARNSYWMVTVILDSKSGIRKEQVMAQLSAQGIASRPFFYPLSSLPAYAGLRQAQEAQERNRVGYAISPYGVNLPCAMNLTQEQVVCRRCRQAGVV